ncbi:MAG: hypothetical protein GFH27_549397n17 [Chloroflexi bacterium AL-W]|nr:hypothetical protein [Chloroflexi bacterium AL-W]
MPPLSLLRSAWKNGQYVQVLTELAERLDKLGTQHPRWRKEAKTCRTILEEWQAECLRAEAAGTSPSQRLLQDIQTWVLKTLGQLERRERAPVTLSMPRPSKNDFRKHWRKSKDFSTREESPFPAESHTSSAPPMWEAYPEEAPAMAAPPDAEMVGDAPDMTPPQSGAAPETSGIAVSSYVAPSATAEWVEVTVYSPEQVQPEQSFLLTAFAHLAEQAEAIAALIRESDPDAVRQGGKTLSAPLERGSVLQCQLSIENWEVDEPVQSLVWLGRPASVEYVVKVPAQAKGKAFGRLLIIGATGPLGRISFNLSLGQDTSSFVQTDARIFHQTYLSFAAQDEAFITQLQPTLQSTGWKWMPITPGPSQLLPDWEAATIPLIRQCELFVLFWSESANDCERVAMEWQVALGSRLSDTDGLPDIMAIQINESSPKAPPELAFIPFLPSFVARLPPLPENPAYTEDATTLLRLADQYVATGDERVFDLLYACADPQDQSLIAAIQNRWHTLRRSERLQRVTADQARVERSDLNATILRLASQWCSTEEGEV